MSVLQIHTKFLKGRVLCCRPSQASWERSSPSRSLSPSSTSHRAVVVRLLVHREGPGRLPPYRAQVLPHTLAPSVAVTVTVTVSAKQLNTEESRPQQCGQAVRPCIGRQGIAR